jgi:hypothetical protein
MYVLSLRSELVLSLSILMMTRVYLIIPIFIIMNYRHRHGANTQKRNHHHPQVRQRRCLRGKLAENIIIMIPRYANGDVFEGNWLHWQKGRRRRATGRMVYRANHPRGWKSYDGSWRRIDLPTGTGGKSYDGSWGLFEGNGLLEWTNGYFYNGGWKEGKEHGEGSLYWKDGEGKGNSNHY